MTFEQLQQQLPDFAKDIKLNISHLLNPDNPSGLSFKQIIFIAMASSYATGKPHLAHALQQNYTELLSAQDIAAAKAAATIMAMNNIYYRFTHSIDDNSFSSMPAQLRMNIMLNPGIDKVNFEFASLAVSAINGCQKCMNAHTTQLEKSGASKQAIQSTIRIASVMHAFALALAIA